MALPVSPNRRLGQNFLTHLPTLERVREAARLSASDRIIEIGPGLGHLTRLLLASGAKVTAIERDARLAAALPADIRQNPGLELIRADAVETGFERFFHAAPLKLVSNLPYSITSPVLRMLTDGRENFSLAVLMVQKEVALRVCAAPGTRSAGAISVLTRMFFDVEKLFDVPPSAFTPRPSVTSSVMRLTPLPEPRARVKSAEFFATAVRAAFSARRKMLKNSLLSAFGADEIERSLSPAGVDGSRRAESLSLEEFARISDRLFEVSGG